VPGPTETDRAARSTAGSPGPARSRPAKADHDYLLEGGVFTPDLIETWVSYKRENEVDPIRLRPHPHEFELYYDV